MKKIVKFLSLVLVAVFALALVGCKKEEQAKEVEYKLGMGIVTTDHDTVAGKVTVNSLVAGVVVSEGKIVACKVDAVQNVATIAEDGTFAVNESKLNNTKKELGENYNMAKYGQSQDNNGDGKVLEWFEQAAAFEAWCVGKTPAEVEALKTKAATQGAIGYMIADDDALLAAGCTIQIADFRDAVVKACKDEWAVTFKTAKEYKLAVAANSSLDSSSKAPAADAAGAINMYSEFAAVVLVEGKVAAALTDATQPKVAYNNATDAPVMTFKGTKRELKEGYNMAAYGKPNYNPTNDDTKKATEWYKQAEAFGAYVVGKTQAEVEAIATQVIPEGKPNAGYVIAADEALLAAGCTIQITGMKAVVAKACSYAK